MKVRFVLLFFSLPFLGHSQIEGEWFHDWESEIEINSAEVLDFVQRAFGPHTNVYLGTVPIVTITKRDEFFIMSFPKDTEPQIQLENLADGRYIDSNEIAYVLEVEGEKMTLKSWKNEQAEPILDLKLKRTRNQQIEFSNED